MRTVSRSLFARKSRLAASDLPGPGLGALGLCFLGFSILLAVGERYLRQCAPGGIEPSR